MNSKCVVLRVELTHALSLFIYEHMSVCECVRVRGFVVGHKALRAVVDGRQRLIVMDNDVRRDKNTAHKIFMLAFVCAPNT